MTREVPEASINLTSFACPHCGAHATQHWIDCYGLDREKENATPVFPDPVQMRKHTKFESDAEREMWANRLLSYAYRIDLGRPFIRRLNSWRSVGIEVLNIHLSKCFTCEEVAVWVHDRLLYPPARAASAPCADLPADVRRDYDEAREVLELSPRGAAALLRLAVQKLCRELGEKGNKIDADIASLVAKGLDPEVQAALDTVRVIGNDAVHPGQIDLRDDRDTALQLFDLVNFIAEQTITRKKRLADMYAKIPQAKRDAIDKRNADAIAKHQGANGAT